MRERAKVSCIQAFQLCINTVNLLKLKIQTFPVFVAIFIYYVFYSFHEWIIKYNIKCDSTDHLILKNLFFLPGVATVGVMLGLFRTACMQNTFALARNRPKD